MAAAVHGLVGREAELERIAELVSTPVWPCAVLVEGEPGIGKTTLWQAGVACAAASGVKVLTCRPTAAEAMLSFAGLGDLTAGLEEALSRLAPSRRRALEVALLLRDPEGSAPDARAIGLALLGLLLALAEEQPVLLAIDDLQWLDASSAAAVGFALRHVEANSGIGLLATVRADAASASVLADLRPESVELAPLSLGALQRLLAAQLGQQLPRPALRRLHDMSGGNPFYALELARRPQGDLPRTLRDAVGRRLSSLSPAARESVTATAALALPTRELLEQAAAAAGLDEAVAEGALEVDGPRVRVSHPLLAAGALAQLDAGEARALHLRLSDLVDDEEERARHLALAAREPDEALAAALEAAADAAARRGATVSAASLAREAAGATPPEQPEAKSRRLLVAAKHCITSGEIAEARAILKGLSSELQPGPLRAQVLVELAAIEPDHAEAETFLLSAIDEAVGDPEVLAIAHRSLAETRMVRGDMFAALDQARLAKDQAERIGDGPFLVLCLGTLCFYETCTALVTPGLLERAVELEAATPGTSLHHSPEQILGLSLMYADRLDEARVRLERVLARALDEDNEYSRGAFLNHLTQLECRAGRFDRADRHAREFEDVYGALFGGTPATAFARAFVDAHLGRVESARAAAQLGLARAEKGSVGTWRLMNHWALGRLELSLGRFPEAAELLAPLPDELEQAGYRNPGARPLHGDAIEALVRVKRLDDAEAVTERLAERGRSLDYPWALAVSARGRGLIAAARGELELAVRELMEALHAHDRSPDPLERARTLLVLGAAQRRLKQKRAAGDSLRAALAVFEELGTPLWAERAQDELARVGGRRPVTTELTETERRVAELVADGRSNQEVAASLFVSVDTVETHLKRIYAKLGICRRGELTGRLG